ncbi:hypothetical protein GMORB2_5931 [Geosmithia morbida]|uniref:protein-tyrosine-phosphatase n=1 Tax=Geosmithia morbida TaxID=1094350 RepID=A0A9P4YWM3_9HYPO|nr:uncharacterized protein GMORB2_5931 [Geosmithia morbida]KAF4124215.1 hypothetical protein GMORB2_5931 [Geosmithia morbida]
MPSAAARRVYEDQIPSFMSVFDLDAETMADRDTVTVVDPRLVGADTKQPIMPSPSQQLAQDADASHKHVNSNSATASADSSPTTTLSTTDSSPLSDPSPSSSPDSPVNLVPLNQYPATTFSARHSAADEPSSLSQQHEHEQLPGPTGLEKHNCFGRPMTSPAPRRRNMKGLSIQPPSVSSTMTSTVTSEPASPSFIKPKIPAMKRKPSTLSLNTNASDLATRPRAEMQVPPSPAMPPILQRRALKHSTSTPHMLSTIKSATFGPTGGMTLPNMLERNESGLSEALRPMKTSIKPTFDDPITEEEPPTSTIRPQMASRMDIEPYHEKVNNEDQKTPGYPDGPIAMYDDNVFLYLEPSSEEAAKFDVVINVAKEVKNPFFASRPSFQGLEQTQQSSTPILSPVPDTAVTDASFATAFEYQPGRAGSSSASPAAETPKGIDSLKKPEYIHIPWDHNTDISPDLMSLCETIEDRTRRGKRVLIHCQQGASRSASLIIAYGLYCRPESSVNDAYYAAQSKSQWISPNMKLMYSLQDFQKELSQKRRPTGPDVRGGRAGRSPTKHRLTLSASAVGLPPKEPRTAPLPGEDNSSQPEGSSSPGGNRLRPANELHRRGSSMPGPGDVSPGPATAPPKMSWQEEVEQGRAAESASSESIPVPSSAVALSAPPSQLSELPERPKQAISGSIPSLPPPSSTRLSEVVVPTIEFGDAPSLDLNLSVNLNLDQPPPTPGFSAPAGFTFQQNKAFPRFSNSARLLAMPPLPTETDEPLPPSHPPAPTRASPPPPARASPPTRASPPPPLHAAPYTCYSHSSATDDDSIMSPRVEAMMSNPLRDYHGQEAPSGMHFAETQPPTPGHDNFFSPRTTMFPRDPFIPFGRPPQVADPRSPPTKGETPIVRSIDDIL